MKIAFLESRYLIYQSDGVRMQALIWKKGFEDLGHEVILLNTWDVYNWSEFDFILCFEYNHYVSQFIKFVSPVNPKIILAPIIDLHKNFLFYKILSRIGLGKQSIDNRYNIFYSIRDQIKLYLVRSEFEKNALIKIFSVPEEKIYIMRLPYRLANTEHNFKKEDFCFHVSLLTNKRKNVKRLIDASKKYKFKLVLAGKVPDGELHILERWIGNSEYIEYVGFLTDEQLIDYYKRAKVFALPSLAGEGVGLVALDAAAFECNIVVTEIGGPKEYYGKYANIVNPYNTDSIGEAVIKAMKSKNGCEIRKYVLDKFSITTTCLDFINKLESII